MESRYQCRNCERVLGRRWTFYCSSFSSCLRTKGLWVWLQYNKYIRTHQGLKQWGVKRFNFEASLNELKSAWPGDRERMDQEINDLLSNVNYCSVGIYHALQEASSMLISKNRKKNEWGTLTSWCEYALRGGNKKQEPVMQCYEGALYTV